MSNLNLIKERHISDRWKDVLFIGMAVLLTAISIGSVTSKAAGSTTEKQWNLAVVEAPELVR